MLDTYIVLVDQLEDVLEIDSIYLEAMQVHYANVMLDYEKKVREDVKGKEAYNQQAIYAIFRFKFRELRSLMRRCSMIPEKILRNYE